MPTVPQLHVPTIVIAGSEQRFPVRRIYCVGRNYADHVREMGNDPSRDLPFFFGKPADAVVGSGLTRRDLQAEAKKSGRPWDMAKGFDHSAPIGPLRPGMPPAAGSISLSINGRMRQSGDLRDMIWSVAEIIAALSGYVELAPGDLIFTGTPAGVGPIERGETLRGMIAGLKPIEITFEE